MGYKKSVFRSLAMVTQLGISVMTPIFLCIFIGYQIDTRLGTSWMIPLMLLGVAAGGKTAWQLTRRVLEQERREEERIRMERESTEGRAGISKPKRASRIRRDG